APSVTQCYNLSLHDALPISGREQRVGRVQLCSAQRGSRLPSSTSAEPEPSFLDEMLEEGPAGLTCPVIGEHGFVIVAVVPVTLKNGNVARDECVAMADQPPGTATDRGD